jgi:hypothetical protein
MSRIQIDGGTQILPESITNAQLDAASVVPVTAYGFATLVNGLAIVNTTFVTSTCGINLTPQDTNTLGTPRVDAIVLGVSFTINSTGATDSGVIYWEIKDAG